MLRKAAEDAVFHVKFRPNILIRAFLKYVDRYNRVIACTRFSTHKVIITKTLTPAFTHTACDPTTTTLICRDPKTKIAGHGYYPLHTTQVLFFLVLVSIHAAVHRIVCIESRRVGSCRARARCDVINQLINEALLRSSKTTRSDVHR
jgi:hypothetical protein